MLKENLMLVEADWTDFESEGLMRHPVVGGQKVHDGQLREPLSSELKDCF